MLTGAAYSHRHPSLGMLPGMANNTIGAQTAIMLRALIANPKKPQYVDGLAAELKIPRPTIRHAMRRLEQLGWLVSSVEPRVRYQPRRFYTLTPHGVKEGRAELKTWDFTDA